MRGILKSALVCLALPLGAASASATVISLGGGLYSVDGGTVDAKNHSWSGITGSQFFNNFYLSFLAPTLSTFSSEWSGESAPHNDLYDTYDSWFGTTSFNALTNTLSFVGVETDSYTGYASYVVGFTPIYGSRQSIIGYEPNYAYGAAGTGESTLNFQYTASFTPHAAVPGPIAGAGVPGIAGFLAVWFMVRRKQKLAARRFPAI